MRPPVQPAPGAPLEAAWGRDLANYLRAHTLQRGPGVAISRGPGGTVATPLRRFSPGLPELRSFRARIDDYGKLRIYKGLRRVIMVSSEILLPAGGGDEFSFDFTAGHSVWMKWTYRTNPIGASNGSWSGLLSGATPDTDNRTQRVVVLCEMVVRHGLRDVFRHHDGAVEIYDLLNCQTCE